MRAETKRITDDEGNTFEVKQTNEKITKDGAKISYLIKKRVG